MIDPRRIDLVKTSRKHLTCRNKVCRYVTCCVLQFYDPLVDNMNTHLPISYEENTAFYILSQSTAEIKCSIFKNILVLVGTDFKVFRVTTTIDL